MWCLYRYVWLNASVVNPIFITCSLLSLFKLYHHYSEVQEYFHRLGDCAYSILSSLYEGEMSS